MILWVKEDTSVTFYELHQQRQVIQCKNCRFTVLKNDDQVCIRTSRGFHIENAMLKDHDKTSIVDQQQNLIVTLLLNTNVNWKKVKKYKMTEKISIGSNEHADIRIHSTYVPDLWIEINPVNKQVQCMEQAIFSKMNGKNIQDEQVYQFLDVLHILEIKIFLLEDGIVISDSTRVEVHLQPYYESNQMTPLVPIKICKKIYNRVPVFPDKFVFQKTCPVYSNVSITNHRPLLLEIGPSFLMAIASLTTGFLSAYQAYLNGKEILSLIPMLLLPSIMVISTILFQPLTRMYEKKQQSIKDKQKNEQKEQLIEECKTKFHQYQNAYLEYVNQFYPEIEDLIPRIKNGDDLYQHGKSLQLWIGKRKNVFSVCVAEEYVSLIKERNEEWNPWIINMDSYSHICILGCKKEYLNTILLQIAAFTDFPLVILAEERWLQERYWLRILPNSVYHGERLLSSNIDQIQKWIAEFGDQKFILIDQLGLVQEDNNGYLISIDSKERACDLTIDLENSYAYDHHSYFEYEIQIPEIYNIDMFELLSHIPKNRGNIYNYDFFSVHKIQNYHDINTKEKWKEFDVNESLQAILGLDEQGNEIVLDLNEKKDGPHGLVAGMTGSGKSEMIISMLFSIAIQYSWEDVQFSLIDFKGGGIASVLQDLPHVTGVVTNLDFENLKRALVSYQNECLNRQKKIAEMNQISEEAIVDIVSYRKHLKEYPDFKKMADLIIVVDEFAELKNQQPDFLNDLISISRIGRSLGIHLVLCTQRPSGIISEEIWSNCGFKIALRVAESTDLQEILHCKCEYRLKDPGDFYVLSRAGLRQGKSAYTGASYRKNGEIVNQITLQGAIQEINVHKTISQQQVLLQLFSKQKNVSVETLWLKPLEQLNRTDFSSNPAFGIIDDFYHRKQYPLNLFQKRNTVFLTNDLFEKRMCFLNILSLFLFPDNQSLLFVIDDLNMEMEDLYAQCPFWISYCRCDHEEYISNIFEYLKKSHEKEKVLVITDVSRFYEVNEERKEILKDLLEHAELYHLQIILFTSSISSISYRSLSYIQNKLCLKNENISEIQQFLETNEKIISLKSGRGLLKEEHVLSFAMYAMSKIEFVNQLKKRNLFDIKKSVTIPSMPEHINRCFYHGTEIPLGCSFESYDWITVKPTESVYIVSEYKEEWNAFYQLMKQYAKCTVRGNEDEEDGQLIFLSSQEYRNKHNDDYPVLYIGKSFSRQYMFHSKYEIHDERDAILFQTYQSEKVRVL